MSDRKMKRYFYYAILSLLTASCVGSQRSPEEGTREMGYKIQKGEVIFEFDVREYQKASREGYSHQLEFSDIEIEKIAVSGEFNDWSRDGWTMHKVDEHIYQLRKKLKDFDGKFEWQYKFLVNEKYWVEPPPEAANKVDVLPGYRKNQNLVLNTAEPSLEGNTTFRLEGYPHARRVYLTGDFVDWQTSQILMAQEGEEWICRINLPHGKHLYKFLVDGVWIEDPANPMKEINQFDTYNSVLYKGSNTSVEFYLPGHENAEKVILAGNFNDWDEQEIECYPTGQGWQYKTKLAPGKYHYKFIVDGHWITDPDNPLDEDDGRGNTNSVLFVGKPILFDLSGFENAQKVFLSGDFIDWKENLLACEQKDQTWIYTLSLPPGRYAYKFLVDGKWTVDPDNPQTEMDWMGHLNSIVEVKE